MVTMPVAAQSLAPRSIVARPAAMTNGEPQAAVRVFSTGAMMAGSGAELINGASISICAVSSTGRFRLRVTSQMGGALTGTDPRNALGYRIRFQDPVGAEQEKPMAGTEVMFEGRSLANAACTQGANATLSVSSTRQQLTSTLAGQYFDRILISIEPI